jgi:peptide/nickel transport system permease protein
VLTFIVRRLLWAGLLGLVITLITFLLFVVVPTSTVRPERGSFGPDLQTQFDLQGKSVPQQYVRFLGHVFGHGDFGRSVRSRRPVTEVISQALPVTASLVIGGTLLWLLLAFPIGMLSALRPRSTLDKSLMLFVLIGFSAHPVWLGLMLSYLFGLKLHVLPVAGYCDFVRPGPSELCGGPKFWAYHMVLPWITFAFVFAALYARMIRASMLETLDEDYVRTARAKGAGTWRLMRRHVLRNALLPIVSMLGMDVGIAFGGAIFIERVFNLPGMGSLLVRSLTVGDLPVIMGIVIVVSLAVALLNLLADVLYCSIDPRVRLRGTGRARARSAVLPSRLRTEPRVTESPG